MNIINKNQLKNLMNNKEDFALVNVLDKDYYNQGHIKGSINISVHDKDFDKKILKKLNNKNKKVVVYCANKQCSASPRAAMRMKQLGFKNVTDYEDGMQEWDGPTCKIEHDKKICSAG
jgi:rhodanese-related sulfurtransferase